MKLDVCKEITSMDLNDKAIALLLSLCLPGVNIESYKQTRLTLKTVRPNRFNLRHFCPFVPSFVFAVLLKCSLIVLRGYFFIFHRI